jgi:excisionase family DNA binding protein
MQTVSQSTQSKSARLASATYSLAEAAALYGVSYTTFHEMAQSGSLPVTPIRIGRQYRFPKSTVDRMLGIESDTAEPKDAA